MKAIFFVGTNSQVDLNRREQNYRLAQTHHRDTIPTSAHLASEHILEVFLSLVRFEQLNFLNI